MLSILIPTIPERVNMFNNLFDEVHRQVGKLHSIHPSLGRVEVIIDDSPKFLDGGLSIGAKRDALLRRSEGHYVCFLDDDESIAPNYVETLVRLCQAGRDLVTFRNITRTDTYWTVVDLSFRYQMNDNASPDYITRRRPWHICPVKTHLAKMYRFDDINYGEDYKWMEQVLKHCTTEAHTEAVIHEYRHGKHSEADKITAYEMDNKSI